MIKFEWDPSKATSNKKKHGVLASKRRNLYSTMTSLSSSLMMKTQS